MADRYGRASTQAGKLPITVRAARGGHGATTIAGAFGTLLDVPVLGHDPAALAWMWPDVPRPLVHRQDTVLDAGVIDHAARSSSPTSASPSPSSPPPPPPPPVPSRRLWPSPSGIDVVVLRGPCSLAVRGLASLAPTIDHLVLIRENGRPLRNRDVECAVDHPVAVEVLASPRVARLVDAGLLPRHVHSLDEFAEFRAWVAATFGSGRGLRQAVDDFEDAVDVS